MKRFACLTMLFALASAVVHSSSTGERALHHGLWKIDGNMMGQPVRMMCALTED